jgi:hypothetical protein
VLNAPRFGVCPKVKSHNTPNALATVHWKNRWLAVSFWLQNKHEGLPTHFLLVMLYLVRTALFSISQVNNFIFSGIFAFHIWPKELPQSVMVRVIIHRFSAESPPPFQDTTSLVF